MSIEYTVPGIFVESTSTHTNNLKRFIAILVSWLLPSHAVANPAYHARIIELNPDIRAAQAINHFSCLEASDAVALAAKSRDKEDVLADFHEAILSDLYLTKQDLRIITGHPTFWPWYNAEFQKVAGCDGGLSSFDEVGLSRRLEVSMLSPAFGHQASLSVYECALSMGLNKEQAAFVGMRALNKDMQRYGKKYKDFADWADNKKYGMIRRKVHPKYGIGFNRYFIRTGSHKASCNAQMKKAIGELYESVQ